jgi:hypothetical protein
MRPSRCPLDSARFRWIPLDLSGHRRWTPQFSAPFRDFPLEQRRGSSISGAEGQWFESTRAYHFFAGKTAKS